MMNDNVSLLRDSVCVLACVRACVRAWTSSYDARACVAVLCAFSRACVRDRLSCVLACVGAVLNVFVYVLARVLTCLRACTSSYVLACVLTCLRACTSSCACVRGRLHALAYVPSILCTSAFDVWPVSDHYINKVFLIITAINIHTVMSLINGHIYTTIGELYAKICPHR